MYDERKKIILNNTIEDTIDKANIDGMEHTEEEPITYDATNYAEPVRVIEPEQPKEEVNEYSEPETEEAQVEESSSDFVFNFDDSFSNSFQDEEESDDFEYKDKK